MVFGEVILYLQGVAQIVLAFTVALLMHYFKHLEMECFKNRQENVITKVTGRVISVMDLEWKLLMAVRLNVEFGVKTVSGEKGCDILPIVFMELIFRVINMRKVASDME